MAVQSVRYRPTLTADTNKHPSQAIWGDCPIAAIKENPTYGVYLQEDFLSFARTEASGTTAKFYQGDAGLWKSYEDTSCTILPLTAFPEGEARLSVTSTTRKASIMELGNGTATTGPFRFVNAAGPKLWFECRVLLGAITDAAQNIFIGMCQSGVAVVPAAATSATTLYDSTDGAGQTAKIGFQVVSAAGTGTGALILATYGTSSVNQTILGVAQIAVASTWYKLGFVFDPQAYYATNPLGVIRKGRFFVNGIELPALGVTDTNTGALGTNPNAFNNLGNPNYGSAALGGYSSAAPTVAAAAFPTNKQMTLGIHSQTATGTASTFDVDYIIGAQVYTA